MDYDHVKLNVYEVHKIISKMKFPGEDITLQELWELKFHRWLKTIKICPDQLEYFKKKVLHTFDHMFT